VRIQSADARRNYALILAGASLEQIARTAGVGSATVRRHFPTRLALLETVSRKRIEELCGRAHELADTADSRVALLQWLSDVIASSVRSRGLAAALALEGPGSMDESTCSAALEDAGTPLLDRAIQDGVMASHVTIDDLITLMVGIVLATEHHPEPATEADRMFQLTVAGLSPQRCLDDADRATVSRE
jgi:AcrR family transcriptional regulator